MRGVAVLGVLAFHGLATTHHGTHRPAVLLWPLAAGKLGVDAFFVLSGYVITRSWSGRAGWRAFLSRRIHRLFPAYWASLAVFVAIGAPHLLRTTEGIGTLFLHVVGQQFLVPNAAWQVNSVYWTLTPTIHFYLLFPVLMAAVKRFRTEAVLLVVVSASIAFRVAVHSADQWPMDTILGRLDQFVLGMLVALIATRSGLILDALRTRTAARAAEFGLTAVLFVYGASWVGASLGQRQWAEVIVHPVFAALLAVRLLRLPTMKEMSVPVRGLAALGTISYSVYLWHLPIVDALGDAGLVGVIAGVAASLVIGTASYFVLERRSLWLRRKDPARTDVSVRRQRDDADLLARVRRLDDRRLPITVAVVERIVNDGAVRVGDEQDVARAEVA